MKKIYFLYSLLAISFFSFSKAQIVNIPDTNFKNALINLGVDTNSDGNIQQAEAQQVLTLDVTGLNISSLEGILYFTNIESLYCGSNHLTTLNVQGLANLQSINCRSNQLSSLNVQGAVSLQYLDCYGNQLTSLNLQGLTSLQELDCRYNQLNSLNLQGATALQQLNCGYNQLVSLNLQGLTNLKYLSCNDNQITSLDFQELNMIKSIDCEYNRLTTLDVHGKSSLQGVNCRQNNLTALNVLGSSNLEFLHCSNNQLTSLNVQGLSNLIYFDCEFNQLTTLDVKDCINLTLLSCSYNPNLVSLFIKNGINEFPNGFIAGVPNIKYICCDENQIAYIQSSLNLLGYTSCAVNSYCSFTPGGVYYTVQGQSKLDLNTNGCDPNDGIFPNLKYSITNGTITGHLISDGSGNYSIPVEAGTHIITPVFENPTYFTATPVNVSASFPTTPSPLVQNFCVVPNGIHHDLEVTLLPITPARPGFSTAKYKLVYKNKGNQPLSGSVEFLYDENKMDFISAAQTVSSQTSGSLVWNYTNLIPFESRSIEVIMRVNAPTDNPAVNVGDILHLQAKINPVISDELPLDNISSLHQTAVGSYDPNDKTCIEGNTITPAMVGNDVHYLIRFENTGNYLAENIVVKDMIDTDKFDISSLQITDTSHVCRVHITNGNKVEFIFENIDLPATPSPNRYGYVAFKIKTKPNLVVGNTFSNNAQIYFDYNLPITTNTATTTIQNAVLGSQEWEHAKSEVSVFPNPVKDILNIKTEEKLKSIEIFDMNGRIIQSIISPQKQINVTNLAKGLYVVKIITEKRIQSEHFIKE